MMSSTGVMPPLIFGRKAYPKGSAKSSLQNEDHGPARALPRFAAPLCARAHPGRPRCQRPASFLHCAVMKKVIIYTDGSCLGNPGRGGWAAILCLVGSTARRELVGGARLTTNNRMELGGVIAALSALREACEVNLYTDSKYVCDAVEKGWLAGWQKRNWIKSDKKPVLNVDLWKQLLPLLRTHKVTFHWLRGHAGHRENERCDELARAFAAGPDLPEDTGFTAAQA